MYKYFNFKRIFEADEATLSSSDSAPNPTTADPSMISVDLKKMNAISKLHILLNGTEVDQLKTQGFLNKTAEWKEIENMTKSLPMQVSLYNADSGKPSPTSDSSVLVLTITNQKLDDILSGISGGNSVELELPTSDKTLEGQPVRVVITREIDLTNTKPGKVGVPASQQEIAEPLPKPAEGQIGESFKGLMKFNQFVNESKKKEKWIGEIDMKKGSLKKSLNRQEITSEVISKELKKLEGKDKDKKKKGLQLSKKEATKQKRLVLAKNLMKAAGVKKK